MNLFWKSNNKKRTRVSPFSYFANIFLLVYCIRLLMPESEPNIKTSPHFCCRFHCRSCSSPLHPLKPDDWSSDFEAVNYKSSVLPTKVTREHQDPALRNSVQETKLVIRPQPQHIKESKRKCFLKTPLCFEMGIGRTV